MKKTIAILSMSLLAATAFAAKPGGQQGGGNPPSNQTSGPAIDISGDTLQMASMSWTAVVNDASGNSSAAQNISSNTGNVTVDDKLTQATISSFAYVANQASGGGVAKQNISSNIGNVQVNDSLTQLTVLKNSAVINRATSGSALAIQNIASNNGCQTCQ